MSKQPGGNVAASTASNTTAVERNIADAVVTKLEPWPEPLRELEQRAVDARRGAVGLPPSPLSVGIGISGGGIRSATFALGVFQSLARKKLLRHVDWMSTVSGGGYFGAFLGALYARSTEDAPNDENEKKRIDERIAEKLENSEDLSIQYLRDNGRYLAPGGTADLFLAGAVLLRNWLALQLILATSLLMLFLLAQGIDLFTLVWTDELRRPIQPFEARLIEHAIWLSPWFVLVAVVLVTLAFPLGWSYWTLGRGRLPPWFGILQPVVQICWAILPNVLLVVASVGILVESQELLAATGVWVGTLALATACLAHRKRNWLLWLPYLFAFAAVLVAELWNSGSVQVDFETLTVLVALVVLFTALVRLIPDTAPAKSPSTEPSPTPADKSDRERSADDRARHRVSVGLKSVLVLGAGLTGFALIDTIGRSLYLAWQDETEVILGVSGGLFGLLWTAALSAKKLAVNFASKADGERPSASLGVIAWVAAGVLVVVVLSGASFAAQAITWDFQRPGGAPKSPDEAPLEESASLIAVEGEELPKVDLVLRYSKAKTDATEKKDAETEESKAIPDALNELYWVLGVTILVSMLLGSSRLFLNRSTHLPLYSARLTRSYLGASNPLRLKRSTNAERRRDSDEPDPRAATRVMPEDDIDSVEYWGWGWRGKPEELPASSHWAKGSPLHILNTTINETVDSRSRSHQSDRKGLTLAVGPCALSVGKRHHLLPGRAVPIATPKDGFHVFRFGNAFKWLRGEKNEVQYPREKLSLGEWMSISGAAFSTGLGSRTHQGLSLLAGFTNVRLGHWWRPGTDWDWSLRRVFGSLFWVQSYLLRELFALFPGTENALWYLSDGGHFENMGGYELIRRRLSFIIIIDGEADAKYEFEGLGNLVRKARIDFNAEIEFIDPQYADLPLGPLAHLRRGKWEKGDEGFTFEADPGGRSLARAALAKVRYLDEPESKPHWLLYIKAVVRDGMPADLEHYASQHPAFPHESTGDQFFDEAQWESYRKLGELTGAELFDGPNDPERVLTGMLRGTHAHMRAASR